MKIYTGSSFLTGLVGFAALMFPLSLPYYAEAQTIPIPEFKPKASESHEPPPIDFAMKVLFEPDENKTDAARGEYQVANFALAVSNSSALCPAINITLCEFEMTGYSELHAPDLALDDNEWSFFGTLTTYVGNLTSTSTFLQAQWPRGNVTYQDGQAAQEVNGTLIAGSDVSDSSFADYQSRINGTLLADGDNIILEAHGVAGSLDDS